MQLLMIWELQPRISKYLNYHRLQPRISKYLNYHGLQTPLRSDQLHKKPAQVPISPQTSRISAIADDALLTHDTTEDQTGACV
jgi:hypothetical protein